MTTIITIYSLVFIGLVASIIKSKDKTKQAFMVAKKSFLNSVPSLLGILGLVGLILGILSPEIISELIGSESGIISVIIAAVIGAITYIPSLIAFPLAGSLLRAGASIATISVFITTLVMVGFVTLPMEIKSLGKKFAILRNVLSFIIAILIALVMGVLL